MSRAPRSKAVRLLAAAVAVAFVASSGVFARRLFDRAAANDARRPSILFILTDDQRFDTLWAMPVVQRRLVAHGIDFANSFVSNSLCCPSRATILTGQYAHTTGVWSNRPPYGGFAAFDDSDTIATRLDGAGYTTAQFGKYLNGYYGTYVPPGWDHWFAFSGKAPYRQRDLYYDYYVNDDGHMEYYGHDPKDYSTDLITDRAVSFIRDTRGPIFMQFATSAPHIPATPLPQDETKFTDLPRWNPPGYNEADVSDKPAYIRGLHRLGPGVIPTIRRRMLQTLQPVDRSVDRLLDALQASGRLANTMIVFMSDNGYGWGEHRWKNKQTPYEHDIRVPLVIRYDRLIKQPRTDTHLVVNTDIAPTFAALAGVAVPRADGTSLIPLFGKPSLPWRNDFLLEHREDEGIFAVPSYCGIRDARFTYVRYFTMEEELYDLLKDPYELNNVAKDPRYAEALAQHRARLRALCNPPPPDPPAGFPP